MLASGAIIRLMVERPHKKILLVTGLSGAGKTTALKTLEDLGWEAVDNFPIRLAGPLLALPSPEGRTEPDVPLALGFDTRTRGFNTDKLIEQIKQLQKRDDLEIMMLFLDCAGSEIERRYSETRRRHPLAQDRPALDGIAQERHLMGPLRRWADLVIDTTKLSASDLQAEIRAKFRVATGGMTVSVMSFGFSRGVPHNADLVFDMRFLKNPHWDAALRPLTGLDEAVADYVGNDPEYMGAIERIRELLLHLLPRYDVQGKAYVTIAFGCTGGRHRSVFVTEQFVQILKSAGFAPSVSHRDLNSRPIDSLEQQGNQGGPIYND
jgi:RNase adapter protein RapZ